MNPKDFNPPGTINVVCDLSHHNQNVDLNAAKNYGLAGFFNKATQSYGENLFKDSTYPERRREAKELNLLFGAFHFGSGGSGAEQADVFLDYTNPQNDTLLALDFEENTTRGESTMNLQDAIDFVSRVKEKTGKYPGIYGGSLLKESLRTGHPILSQCWLWLSEYPLSYMSAPRLPNGWTDYTFWQYTDGIVNPKIATPIDGIGFCDRNLFKGTPDELLNFWQANKV